MAKQKTGESPLRIGVLSALVSEIEPLLGWVQHVRRIPTPVGLLYQASYGEHELFLGVAGTQKTNTAAALQALITGYSPDVLFFTGVAGSLDPELLNDVVLASSVVHHDAGVLYGSPLAFHPFGPRIVDEASEHAALWGRVNRFDSDRRLLRAARQAAIKLTSSAPDRKFKEGVIATGIRSSSHPRSGSRSGTSSKPWPSRRKGRLSLRSLGQIRCRSLWSVPFPTTPMNSR